MNKELPKGLIIQHSPLSLKDNNGKTTYKRLLCWSNHDLYQLYLNDQVPDMSLCSSYYHMSSSAIIKSIFFPKKKVKSDLLRLSNCNLEQNIEPPISNVGKSRILNLIHRFLHGRTGGWVVDFAWKKNNPFNTDFLTWFDGINPDFVLLGASTIPYVLYKTLELCKQKKIPLFLGIGDDYYTYPRQYRFFANQYNKSLKLAFRDCVNYSSGIIAISEEMKDRISTVYGGKYIVAMNAVNFEIEHTNPVFDSKEINISYFGNISLNRWKTILWLGNILLKINPKVRLLIYTDTELDKKTKNKLNNVSSIIMQKPVYGSELFNAVENSSALLFAESFEKKFKRQLETAISTKVPDYLASKRPIIAIGPYYSASIKFLESRQCGFIIHNCTDLSVVSVINELQIEHIRSDKVKRAYEIVKNDFNENIMSVKVKEFILNGISDYKRE